MIFSDILWVGAQPSRSLHGKPGSRPGPGSPPGTAAARPAPGAASRRSRGPGPAARRSGAAQGRPAPAAAAGGPGTGRPGSGFPALGAFKGGAIFANPDPPKKKIEVGTVRKLHV